MKMFLLLVSNLLIIYKTQICNFYIVYSFDRYKCKSENIIGQGASSKAYIVYLQSDPNEEAVLKVTDCETKDDINKVKKEFELIKRLNHPNLIKLKSEEMIQYNKKCFRLEERGELGSLKKLIDKHKPNEIKESSLLEVLFGIAKGLKELKDNNIIHADLKPDNIVFTYDETPKIIDFDISIVGTQIAGLRGTPYFLDPEILKWGKIINYSHFGYHVDIYDLGVTLYYMNFHTTPYSQSTSENIYDNILRGLYEMPGASPIMIFLIFHLMAHKKENRPTIEQALKWIVFAIRWNQQNDKIILKSKNKLKPKQNQQKDNHSEDEIPDITNPDIIENFKNSQKLLNLDYVDGKKPFPTIGWNALEIDSTLIENDSFLDLENSGLLMKFDWGLASYIKTNGINQNTNLKDIPINSDEVPTELPKKNFFQKVLGGKLTRLEI